MKSLSALLLLTALASIVPCARAQSVTLTTPDNPVGDAVETTEDTLGDLSGGDVSPQGSLDDSTDALGNTAGDAVDSGTSAGTSPGKAFRSRFDRLPSRLERLLERIELGRNVRANLRRLEQALASLTVRERARLVRLLNAEIRRLRADGVSHADRRRIDRLIRARAIVTTFSGPTTTLSGPTPISALAGARTGTPAKGPAPGMNAPFAGGYLEASVVHTQAPPSGAGAPPSGGGGDPSEPSEPSELPASPLTEILLVLCAVLLVVLGALAIKEERSVSR
jgi:hypothetical protein